jgi:hypothetical protein
VLERARPGFSEAAERSYEMDPATSSYEAEGVAERRAQKELTERIGVTLVRRSKASNLKWGTWKWRFGMRGEARPG